MMKSVREDSRMGLAGWLKQEYPLILVEEIPTPEQMLEIQCQGKRYVTLLEAPEWQQRKLGRHNGAFEFLLHDLEHAHKFLGDKSSHRGQVHFFRLVKNTDLGHFLMDEQFRREYHYLISDMNSHPVHLLKYLKAIVLNAFIRETGNKHIDLDDFWSNLFASWNMNDHQLEAGLRINAPGIENPDAQKKVFDFFLNIAI
jgi:hypothetical protein